MSTKNGHSANATFPSKSKSKKVELASAKTTLIVGHSHSHKNHKAYAQIIHIYPMAQPTI